MMKSKVCTIANSFIREGMSRSAAFVKAWALAKIEKIDNELFLLNMKDRHTAAERETVRTLTDTRRSLNEKANPVVKAFRGWSIYQATTENDRIGFEECKYAAFLPDESPHEFFNPEWCADSIKELLDFIWSY